MEREPDEPKLDVQAPEPDEPEPEPDEPKLDLPVPDLPPANTLERCRIVLEGRGPDIVRAIVKADSGLHTGTVERGRTVGYGCPELADRTNVDLIAALEHKKTVHWSDVRIDAEGEGTIASSASKRGLPEGLTPEQIRQIEKDFQLPPAERRSPPPPTSSVTFMPHQFPWAEITLAATGKRPKVFVLEGMLRRDLSPGSYTVSFRDVPDGPPRKAGVGLVIEAGKSYTVKMLKRSPHLSITAR